LTIGYSQNNEITIRYIGNCGLHLTDGITNIYTDFPYVSGFHQYVKYDDSELDEIKENSFFIFTHNHPDHYSKKRLRRVLKNKGGSKYGNWDVPALEALGKTIPDFQIQAFKTKHSLSRKHYSYLITWHGKKIFLSGDTEYPETITSIKDMDWAFMPAWLVKAALMDNNFIIDSKRIAVYHIGTKDEININGDRFLMLKKQGEIISLSF
jgi:L-ascorbate metabolism protein UlaG (beta-lactamase superfamily)